MATPDTLLVGPVDQPWLARFSEASGDDNPLHRDNPLGPGIIHGNLIACLIESAVLAAYEGHVLQEIAIRFLRPVSVDSVIGISLKDGGRHSDSSASSKRVRARVTVGQELKAIADLWICQGRSEKPDARHG